MVNLLIKEVIVTGASIDEAKAAAPAALGVTEDADIKYEVIEMPKAKVLGLFGGAPAKIRASIESPESPFEKAEQYLRTILASLGNENIEITFEEDDEDIRINLTCEEDYGSIIGRRGETLDAIQYLVRLVLNKGTEGYKRVSLNIGDYREKRESTLRALARKNAAKVKKYGRNVVLDPMNPYERRIIHTAIQEIEGVSSHSVGSDGDRKVVITLEEGFKPTNGYGNRKGGYNGNRGRRDNGYNKNNRSSSVSQPSRPPRSDSASASLYGKIETNK